MNSSSWRGGSGAAVGDGHAGVLGSGGLGHSGLGADDGDEGKVVALSDIEVVGVVGGRHLHRPSPEPRIDRLVGDYRNNTVHER